MKRTGIILLLLLTGCTFFGRGKPEPASPIYEANGVKLVASVREGHLAVYDGKGWRARFWAGVNLGATVPGTAPGELAPRKSDYRRWFPMMKAMNARVLRVYTILPPDFYAALAEFNASQREPLWLIQGIWSPEEELIGHEEKGNDAFRTDITQAFRQEITNAVKVVHGDIALPPRPGHAGGEYRTDVSRYLLGWLVGTEWHQRAVKVTNDAHRGMAPYQGKYFAAKVGAAPFESWLAQMLDHTAAEEMHYGWQHPLAFTNWPTTDPLAHPDESNPEEDLVAVDPMHLGPTAAFGAGYYTAYHIYPYYPDFMRYEARYQGVKNLLGEPDPYVGYLREIRAHHGGIPFIVAEFGVPSSRGMAHRAPLERHQGMHSEAEMGRIDADMLANIHNEGFDGAVLFAWQDEWHKFTWNTVGLEVPADRRPLWRNRLTNEEHFGVISVEAGKEATPIYLDGKLDDWERRTDKVVREYGAFDLAVTHDEAYVYLLFRRRGGTWDSAREALHVGLSTLGAGSRTADRAPGVTFSRPIEFLLSIRGAGESRLLVNSSYDQHTFTWGEQALQVAVNPQWRDASKGIFLPWKLMLNRVLVLRQSKRTIPAEEVEVGVLSPGRTDPTAADFDSLADWYAAGEVLEVRLPWMLLGFTDPSGLQVWQYPYKVGKLVPPLTVEGLWVEPHLVLAGGGVSPAVEPLAYRWEKWDATNYYERKKAAYGILSEAFARYSELKGQP